MAPRHRSRSRSLVLVALGVFAFFTLVACIKRGEPVRVAHPLRVAVAVVVDVEGGGDVTDAPKVLQQRVLGELRDRNLKPTTVVVSNHAEAFASKRTTEHRLAHVHKLRESAELLVLVETKARYYSQLNGRYRWTVHTRATIASPRAQQNATSREFEYAAFLDFDHEREPEALETVAGRIGDAVGRLADDFLGAFRSRAANDAIYFIMVDRFANGDLGNDGSVDPSDPEAFHGGDLKGVIDHLDHIQSMGIKTIWLSPVFASQHEKFNGYGAYHGYWVLDLHELEPRFGDKKTLQTLSAELHERDMELMLDVVLNHVGFESPYRKRTAWFHNQGGIVDWKDRKQLQNHDVHGLPDLDQDNPEVYEYLIDGSAKWVAEVKADGFRLDAVKHVPLKFWSKYNDDMRKRAGRDFTLLGEDLDGDPLQLSRTMRAGKFSAMFDFPLHFAMVDVYCRDAPPARLATMLYADRFYDDPARLVTLLDNHDLPRVLSVCNGDVERVKQAIEFMVTARGVPSFTYGSESGLTGMKEPDNRADMVFERHPLKKHIRQMLELRAKHAVLREGKSRLLHVDEHVLAYARVLPHEAAVIVVNRATTARTVAMPPELGGKKISVGPRSNRVVILSPTKDLLADDHPRRVAVEVSTRVALADGERLMLTGSDPALGYWNPTQGIALQNGRATLELERGGVFQYKLVVVPASGDPRWEEGANRCLYVQGPRTLRLTWSQTAGSC